MWQIVLILICAININSGNPVPELSEEDRENLKIHMHTVEVYYEKIKSREKRSVASDSDDSFLAAMSSKFSEGSSEPSAICPACGFLIEMMQGFINEGLSDKNITDVAAYFCQQYTGMPGDMCQGLLQINMPPLLYILRARDFTSSEICSIVISQECRQPDDPPNDWEVDIPPFQDPEPERTENDIPEDAPKLIVWHLSDTHLDLEYVENVAAECKYPLCCRGNSGEPEPNTSKSGKWGGKKCDTPKITLENLFRHVREKHPIIDLIYWTGDLLAHDAWSSTKNDSLLVLDETISLFYEYFPNTTVVYSIGNHEAVPMNMFPVSDVSDDLKVDWLYNALSEKLSTWLPEDTLSSIRFGAYYTFLIRPGFRIISLNTNYCYTGNWWLALNSTDPAQQLQWLVEVLQEAENNGEKVHILGHIPPGYGQCLKVWQRNYYRIVNRFSRIIAAQFFGHTHKDEIGLHFDENDIERPVGIAYIGCSVSPYTFLNPCYTIFYIDGDRDNSTRRVTEKECYYFNLDEANEIGSPIWTKLYSAKEAYNMKSLTPEDWKSFYDRLKIDDALLDLYQMHRWRDSPNRPPCNREKILCNVKSCAIYGIDSIPESTTTDSPEGSTTTNLPPEGTTSADNSDGNYNTESPGATTITDIPNNTDTTENINTTDNPDGASTTSYSDDANTIPNSDDTTNTYSPDGPTTTENSEISSTEPQTT